MTDRSEPAEILVDTMSVALAWERVARRTSRTPRAQEVADELQCSVERTRALCEELRLVLS